MTTSERWYIRVLMHHWRVLAINLAVVIVLHHGVYRQGHDACCCLLFAIRGESLLARSLHFLFLFPLLCCRQQRQPTLCSRFLFDKCKTVEREAYCVHAVTLATCSMIISKSVSLTRLATCFKILRLFCPFNFIRLFSSYSAK